MTIAEIESVPFVFIVGRGRSGTTLLQTILDTHEQIQFPIESRLIIYLSRKYSGNHKLTDKFIRSFLDDLFLENKFRTHWKIKRKELESLLNLNLGQVLSFETLCKIVYLQYPSIFNKTKIKLIGDKNPTYSLFTGQLIDFFPNARFIHLIRNPKDNIVSHRDTFSRSNIAFLAHGWISYNHFIEKYKKLFPDKFITIRYEDLVSNPTSTITIIAKHLNIDENELNLNPELESNKNYHTQLKGKEFEHFHKNLLKPINTEQIEKWKQKLTEKEINLIEYITHEYAAIYNYSVEPYSGEILYPIKSIIARRKYQIYNGIIIFYYHTPIALRKCTHFISKFIFKYFKYYNYFNLGDYRFKEE